MSSGIGLSARTWLYVPGDRPDRMAKALASGADAVIWDLEDAVAPANKDGARAAIASGCADLPAGAPPVWVRVNNDAAVLADDLAAAAGATGVFWPKCEQAPPAIGMPVIAMIESAAGVLAAGSILAAPGVVALAIGEADLSADLGIAFGDDNPLLAHVRCQLVLASTAAGAHPPVGPVTFAREDLAAYRRSCESLAAIGIYGRQVIHPAQIAPAHEVFTPSPAEVAAAEELVIRFEQASAAGTGVYTGTDGRMIDLAVVNTAHRLLARALLARGR
jgi:citrate lyase subunit beta/citryl-CoA lyase